MSGDTIGEVNASKFVKMTLNSMDEIWTSVLGYETDFRQMSDFFNCNLQLFGV